jgi:tetratricopeptide (TPR) repeat protein
LNGFGLARIARGRPREAAQFFAAAVQRDSSYAPAILNLATVNAQYLHDNKTAQENYRAYLALTPRPADWDDVNNLANNLEQSSAVAVANPPPEIQNQSQPAPPPMVVSEPKPETAAAIRSYSPPKMQQSPHKPPQAVKVQPPPTIVATTPTRPTQSQSPGVLHNLNPAHWFNSSPQENYSENGVTPLPSENPLPAPVPNSPAAPKPVKIAVPAPPAFPRYVYLLPRKPKAGNRFAASGEFTKARAFEQDSQLADAAQSYQKAAQLDPAWFEAQYNYGVLEYRLRNFRQTLAACETALAIKPDSADARYNFALALKSSGYVTDAVNELKKVVASNNPDDAPAHLVLGDIYAQQLHETADARLHYLKFLDLDPRNLQAANVRFWLASNPQ